MLQKTNKRPQELIIEFTKKIQPAIVGLIRDVRNNALIGYKLYTDREIDEKVSEFCNELAVSLKQLVKYSEGYAVDKHIKES